MSVGVGTLREPLSGRVFESEACRRRVIERAALLRRAGFQPRDRLFLHYGNSAEFFFDVMATWLLGGCAVPVDPRLTAFEVDTLTAAARPRFSVFDRDPDAAVVARLAANGVRVLRADERVEGASSAELAPTHPHLDDDALMLFTSGTTGSPKGVVHSHRSLQSRLASERDVLGVAPFARTLCITPTNFAWGLVGNSLYAWLSGQEVVILPAFRSDLLLRLGALCDEYGITHLPSVPAMWKTVLRMSAPPKNGSLQRIACCTAPLSAALWNDVARWGGTDDVLNIYGMTECGWMTWATKALHAPEDGLVGVPFGCSVAILPFGDTDADALTAEPCAPGTTGHVWVQTPALMRGYLDRDDLTRKVVARGSFVTGDLGSFDERGRLFLHGREKEMINVGGVKVYPADVDAVVERSGLSADVCAFGITDPVQGEQVAIAVVPADDPGAEIAAIHRWTRERLAAYQVPRIWYRVGEIPRTARGKLDRAQVARLCAELQPLDLRALERASQPPATASSGA